MLTTPRELARRRLFTMLTALASRYPRPATSQLIAALHQWLGGWPGIGWIVTGMARQQDDLQLARDGQ